MDVLFSSHANLCHSEWGWGVVDGEGIGVVSCGDGRSGIGVLGTSLPSRKPLNTTCLAESIYSIFFPLRVSIASVEIIAPVLHSLLAQIPLFAAGSGLDIFISGKEGIRSHQIECPKGGSA